jgi:hypothetical protein
MKRIHAFLGILFIAVPTLAQIRVDTAYSSDWNKRDRQWEHYTRTVTTYTDNQKTSECVQVADDRDWINYTFMSYSYVDNRLTEELEQYWDEARQRWVDNYHLLYEYDKLGRVKSLVHQNIYNSNIIDGSREVCSFNADGSLRERLIQRLNHEWENFILYQSDYDDWGRLKEERMLYWNGGSWDEPFYKWYYTYDDNGALIEKHKIHLEDGKYRNNSLENYSYDEFGNLTETYMYVWNDRRKFWDFTHRIQYNLDESGHVVSRYYQTWANNRWHNYIKSEVSDCYSALTYEDFEFQKTFSIEPNMFNTGAKIKFENPDNELYSVRILDGDGLTINSVVTDKDYITVSNKSLDKGIYFIELQGTSAYSGMFTLE